MRPVRIAFVINSLLDGGAERVLQRLLENIGERADLYDVHLILLDDEPEMRRMPAYVTIHRLRGGGGMIGSLVRLLACLRDLKPALAISFLVRANAATAVACRILGAPAILCERMHLGLHIAGRYSGPRRLAAWLLPRLTYGLATVVLGVSEGASRNLVQEFGLPARKVRTINNPYDLEAIRREAMQPPPFALPAAYVAAAGRLVPGKNFGMLIESHRLSGVPHDLVILGEGPERQALEGLVDRLGMAGRVRLPGYLPNPFPVIRGATMFVSASLNEGFPNALAEAMVLGVPVVSTDCRSGPSEILARQPQGLVTAVTEAEHGVLVAENSPELLARGMRLMADPARRARYAAKAMERMNDFEASKICDQYWRVIDALSGARAMPRTA